MHGNHGGDGNDPLLIRFGQNLPHQIIQTFDLRSLKFNDFVGYVF